MSSLLPLKRILPTAVGLSTVLALTACAGGAAGGGDTSDVAGFAHGASQEEVDAAIADLDPVTLVFQPAAASESAPANAIALAFKDGVEERSGGKITVDIVWNHAIASIPDTEDALADGRVDISHAVPVYKPNEFTGINALSNVLGNVDPSPAKGELIANAVAQDIAWNTPELLDEYDAQGLVPLLPAYGAGYYGMCAEPGASKDDWKGRQVRIASNAHTQQIESIGATPVSMEYTETFEALQRGAIDCTVFQLNTAAIAGLFEVAPNVSIVPEVGFTRALSATLAGSNFKNLPLPYQQIVFDYFAEDYAVTMWDFFVTGSEGIGQAKGYGGVIEEFDQESADAVRASNEAIIADVEAAGTLGDDISTRLTESIDRWTAAVEELGIEDGGTLADFDEWYDGTADDYRELGDQLFEAGALAHRPE